MIRLVVERHDNHENRARGEEPPVDDPPLSSGKGHGEGVRYHHRRTVVEEGGGHGEDIEATMESDNGNSGIGSVASGSERRLTKSDVSDSSGTG